MPMTTDLQIVQAKFGKSKSPFLKSTSFATKKNPGPDLAKLAQDGVVGTFVAKGATFCFLTDSGPKETIVAKLRSEPGVLWTEEAIAAIGPAGAKEVFLEAARLLVKEGKIQSLPFRKTLKGKLAVSFVVPREDTQEVSPDAVLSVARAHMRKNMDGTAGFAEVAKELDCHPNAVKEAILQVVARGQARLIKGMDSIGHREAGLIYQGETFYRFRLN